MDVKWLQELIATVRASGDLGIIDQTPPMRRRKRRAKLRSPKDENDDATVSADTKTANHTRSD
jgi:hypothetical protein